MTRAIWLKVPAWGALLLGAISQNGMSQYCAAQDRPNAPLEPAPAAANQAEANQAEAGQEPRVGQEDPEAARAAAEAAVRQERARIDAEEAAAAARAAAQEGIQRPAIRRIAPAVVPNVMRRAVLQRAAQAQQLGAAVAEQEGQETRGALEDLSNVFAAIIDVELRNDRLVLSPQAGYREFQQALFSNAGQFGGGGTSSSGDGRQITMNINWQRLNGMARISMQAPSEGELRFSENDYLRRSLTCRWTAEGDLEFSVWSPSEPLFLQLKTSAEGPMTLVFLGATGGAFLQGQEFTAMLRTLDSESRDQMLGAIRRLGLPLPPTPYEPAVMEVVRQRLALTIDEAERTEFQNLVADFDDNAFEKREACSSRLKQEFARWRDLISVSLDDEAFSLEARSRMREVFRELVPSEERETLETAVDLGLTDDPGYLVFLLADTDAEGQTPIIERLTAITSLDHGGDIAAWRDAIAPGETLPADGTLETPEFPSGSQDPGQLEKIRESIATLVRFTMTDDQLVFDQAIWQEPYQGRTIQEVNEEILATLEQYHLPRTLWQGDQLERLGDAAYPVALVMGMESVVRGLPSQAGAFVQSGNNGVGPNPQFTWNAVSVRLVTQDVPNRNVRQVNNAAEQGPARFDFAIAELTDPGRDLRFGCRPNSDEAYLALFDHRNGTMFNLSGSQASGWTLHLVTDSQGLVDHAETVAALVERYPNVFSEFIGPRLAEIGVRTPWAPVEE
ncbi:MAG: hypothetical protein KDA83_12100 [Planctomycetales bacterium]|nr:hypothetical protein [Planctomycetales bacterium]